MLLAVIVFGVAPRTLIVGGGPSRDYNQVAIESNVRYVARMLPPNTNYRVLFADGVATHATVRYTPDGATPGRGDRYRPPHLPRLDGPTRLGRVRGEIAALKNADPLFLYFTGHGSLSPDLSPDTSEFDLWGDQTLTLPALARTLAGRPKAARTTILMVQCHAGGFAKLLFPEGDPSRPPLDNRLCGFFASIESRPAAGCTAEIDEKEYRDFTGYFVAALTGVDRMGRKVEGADFDHDGRVGMNEAFCWSLIHDDSIDTPVCTSDEFLRHVVKMSDGRVFATAFADVLAWATPAQRAALVALQRELKLTGDGFLKESFERYAQLDDDDDSLEDVKGLRFLRLVKSVVLAHHLPSMASESLRHRYADLLADEATNPFRDPAVVKSKTQ